MNFFNVGFVFLSLHLNSDMPLNYVFQLVGCIFMLAGVKETENYSKDFSLFSKPVWVIAAVSAAGLIFTALENTVKINASAANIVNMILGSGSAVLILICQKNIVKLMASKHELVNDPSLLHGFSKVWKKMAFFTAMCIVCDVFNRILPSGNLQVAAGTILFFAKIICFIYVALMGAAFNRVRMDFNVTHPV